MKSVQDSHEATRNGVQTSKASEYCSASKYCYANVPNRLRDRNARMEIWMKVNCFDLCRVATLLA